MGYTGGTHTLADVRQMVADGRLQLWPASDTAVLTEVVQFPRKRILNYFLAGGNLDAISSLQPGILAWAKSHGCSQATFTGRPGWCRVLTREPGWSPGLVQFERDL